MPNFVTDSFDEAILEVVQRNNQLSHAAIGVQVNLSASAVRRRLKALRATGVIQADISLVDPARLGLTFIVQVYFEREDPSEIQKFTAQMQAESMVSQCYATSGDCDYWLVVHARSPEDYETWGQRSLMANTSIKRYTTSLVWSRAVYRTTAAM